MAPALARFVRCSMGFTTSYWQKERWSRRAADTLTSYGRCWNPSLGNWDVNWRVGVLSEEQTPQVIVFSGWVSEEEEQKDRLLCAQARRSPSRPVELSFSRSPGCIVENMRVASVRAARRKLVKLFRKPNSLWLVDRGLLQSQRTSTQKDC